MALPDFSIRQMLEAGVHFGHQKHRWNPKMEKYIFGTRNKIHIMDLSQTVPLLYRALQLVSDTVADGGRVLFVGTKRQAAPIVADSARLSAQYFVNSRWLGGMLTNWQTMSKSIARLRELEAMDQEALQGLTKKERLQLERQRFRLDRDLGGIKDMGNLPSVLFVIDTNKEQIAIQEARRLSIPVIAVIDSNSNPDMADLPIPGNDDAARAIEFYCNLIAKAALDGIARSAVDTGADVGAASEAPVEEAIAAPQTEPVEEEKKVETGSDKSERVVHTPTVEAKPEEKSESEKPAQSKSAKDKKAKADKKEPAEKQELADKKEPAEKKTPAKKKPETNEATAKKPAKEDKSEEVGGAMFTAPKGDPDDLKKISGVGPALEKKLHALGITKFSQIAAFTPENIEQVDTELNFKGRIERDNWLEQASDFAKNAD